jgi:glycine/D-amino acid oxidase-like deaminating enzyme
MTKKEVIVIGGGIIGSSVAYFLKEKGYWPILVDKDNFGKETSSACEGTVIMQSKQPGPKLELALKSRTLYQELSRKLVYDIEYREKGGLVLLENEQQAAIMKKTMLEQETFGLQVKLLTIHEARKLEPVLSKNLWGAIYSDADAQVNPIAVTRALLQDVVKDGGTILPHTKVEDLLVEQGNVCGIKTNRGEMRAAAVVNAAGIWSSSLTARYGYEPKIIPRRGQILVTEAFPPTVRHIMICACYLAAKHHPELLDPTKLQHKLGVGTVIEQTVHGQLLIGSTREFVGINKETTLAGIQEIARHVMKLMPGLKNINVIRSFSGLRPKTENGLPILGPVKELPGLFMATGHEGDGIALAPITGKILADQIAETGILS